MPDLPAQRSLAEVVEMVAQTRAIGCVRGTGADTAADALDAVLTSQPWRVVRLQPSAPGDRSALADALYEALELPEPRPRRLAEAEDAIADRLRIRPPIVVLDRAHELRTIALQVLYGLWAHHAPTASRSCWPETPAWTRSSTGLRSPASPRACTSGTASRPPPDTRRRSATRGTPTRRE